jgi:hypothetical protein
MIESTEGVTARGERYPLSLQIDNWLIEFFHTSTSRNDIVNVPQGTLSSHGDHISTEG